MDGVHLKMQLYPVQILSVAGSHESTGSVDKKHITVSSTTGFEVNVNRRANESGSMNVINSNKGTVHKDFVIDCNTNRMSREIYADRSLNSTDLILTLISQ